MIEPARSLFGADVFLPASRVLVLAALLAASTMRALTAGRSMAGGGDHMGRVGARQVEPGVHVLLLPTAPGLGSGSLGSRGETVTKIARKVEQIGHDSRRDSACTRCRGDKGSHGRTQNTWKTVGGWLVAQELICARPLCRRGGCQVRRGGWQCRIVLCPD